VSRLKTLNDEYKKLRARLEQGGGAERIKRQHDQKKLTARERVAALLDKDGPWVEVGLLVAYDQYDGQAPAAGVVTGLGRIVGDRWWSSRMTRRSKRVRGGRKRSRRSSARKKSRCASVSRSSTWSIRRA
jgi:acetyl-CoA carboxylase carboxyltransferase component